MTIRFRLDGPPANRSMARRIAQTGRSVAAGTRHNCERASNHSSEPTEALPMLRNQKMMASSKSRNRTAFSGHAGFMAVLLFLLTTVPASAQALYFPWVAVTVTQSAGTITAGGAFQTALAANSARKGCLIQNTSSHTMSVFVGTLGSATTGASIQLGTTIPTSLFYCNAGPAVMTQDINVETSTTSDTFVVLSMQ